MSFNTVILKEDHERFLGILGQLRDESNAKFAFLLDKSGQQLANVGDLESVDPTALASLAAGNVAATEGLAELIGENEFATLVHEGRTDSLHISVVCDKVILLISFNEQSSLGLVRLRVQQHMPELSTVVNELLTRNATGSMTSAAAAGTLPEITDEDIDALFG